MNRREMLSAVSTPIIVTAFPINFLCTEPVESGIFDEAVKENGDFSITKLYNEKEIFYKIHAQKSNDWVNIYINNIKQNEWNYLNDFIADRLKLTETERKRLSKAIIAVEKVENHTTPKRRRAIFEYDFSSKSSLSHMSPLIRHESVSN